MSFNLSRAAPSSRSGPSGQTAPLPAAEDRGRKCVSAKSLGTLTAGKRRVSATGRGYSPSAAMRTPVRTGRNGQSGCR